MAEREMTRIDTGVNLAEEDGFVRVFCSCGWHVFHETKLEAADEGVGFPQAQLREVTVAVMEGQPDQLDDGMVSCEGCGALVLIDALRPEIDGVPLCPECWDAAPVAGR